MARFSGQLSAWVRHLDQDVSLHFRAMHQGSAADVHGLQFSTRNTLPALQLIASLGVLIAMRGDSVDRTCTTIIAKSIK